MLAAAAHVLLERLQSIFVRFCGPMAMFRGHIVEPPCDGNCNFIGLLKLACYGMFCVAWPRMVGWMGPLSNRRGRIITGHRHIIVSLPRGARRRTARFDTHFRSPAPAMNTCGTGGSTSSLAGTGLLPVQSRPQAGDDRRKTADSMFLA